MTFSELKEIKLFRSICLSMKSGGVFRRNANIPIRLMKGGRIILGKNANIINNGFLQIGERWDAREIGQFTNLSLGNNSTMKVNGVFSIISGCSISVRKNATLELGSGFMNNRCQIICSERISIGERCAIGPDVIIRDSDDHDIISDSSKKNKACLYRKSRLDRPACYDIKGRIYRRRSNYCSRSGGYAGCSGRLPCGGCAGEGNTKKC